MGSGGGSSVDYEESLDFARESREQLVEENERIGRRVRRESRRLRDYFEQQSTGQRRRQNRSISGLRNRLSSQQRTRLAAEENQRQVRANQGISSLQAQSSESLNQRLRGMQMSSAINTNARDAERMERRVGRARRQGLRSLRQLYNSR